MLRPADSPPGLPTLIVATGLAVLTLNMFAPALPSIAEDLGTDYETISIAISGYFALTAVLQLIIGPLSDNIGRRPVLIAGVAIFTLASVGCTLAPTTEAFLAFRVLQTTIITGSVLSTATVRDMLSGAEATRTLGIVGMAMALGPMVGPFVGGIVDTFFGWRAVFAIYAILGVLAFVLVWSDLGETNKNAGRPILEQLKAYPILLKDLRFWAFSGTNALSLAVFYSFILGAPLVGTAMGISPAWIGVIMGATPAGYLLGNVITTRLARSRSNGQLIVMGRSVTFAGMLCLYIVALTDGPLPLYFALMITIGIGNGLTLPGAYSGSMSVRPDLAGSAAGLNGSMNVGLGAIVTAISGVLLPATKDITVAFPILLAAFAGLALAAGLITRGLEKRAG